MRAGMLVLLGTLVFAGSASADPIAEPSAGEVAPVEHVSEKAAGEAAPVEQVPEESAGEVAPGEQVSEQPAGEVAPVEQVSEQPAGEVAPVEQVSEQSQQVAPVEAITEQPQKVAPIEPITEQAVEGSLLLPSGAPQNAGGPDGGPRPAEPEASAALFFPPTTGLTAGDTGETPGVAAASPTPVGESQQSAAAQRAAALRCELSVLPGSMTGDCAAGWLGGRGLVSASAVVLPIETAARAVAPADGGSDGSPDGSRSVTPPPGPAPSGAVGGSATGGSGLALSGFFTLAGLLLLAAPRAMRRLRLSCRPWLTAFFVLIPERPG